jgi:hypothetical protein
MQRLEGSVSFSRRAEFGEAASIHAVDIPEHRESREAVPESLVGRVVSLTGTHGVLDCRLDPEGENWSVGHLIAIPGKDARLVGVISGIESLSPTWSDSDPNPARATFDLHGEILETDLPTFHRGVRAYPSLGARAHLIRTDDLRVIYTIRGRRGKQIGYLAQNHTVPAEISVDTLVERHFAVIGMTGVGKTTATSVLISRAVSSRPNLRVLVLDSHNEYAGRFAESAHVIDSNTLELPIWMFRFDELSDVVFGGRPGPASERDALYESIQNAKTRHLGQERSTAPADLLRRVIHSQTMVTPDTPCPFQMSEAIAIIDEWIGKLEPPYPYSDLRSLRARLDGISRDPRYRFMFPKGASEQDLGKVIAKIFRIPTLGSPITLVRLAGLPNEVTNSVVSVLARLAFDIAFLCTGRFEALIICEEAHRYISSANSDALPVRRAIGRIAKEGRKYGVAIGIVSPRPSELDPTILSQCNTLFAMRLGSESDKRFIGEAIAAPVRSMIDLLPSIADREALAFGEAVAMPMHMRFSDWSPHEQRPDHPEATPIDLSWLVGLLRYGERGRG